MLEERRKNAMQALLLAQSSSQHDEEEKEENKRKSLTDVAHEFGVTHGAVSHWLRAYREAGNSLEGLNAKKHTGRPPRMSEEEKGRLYEMIRRGAKYYGFETDIWTTERIATLIAVHFKIRYDRDHIGRILHPLGLSWQMPKKKARERNEEEVRNWVENVVPQIKKSSKKRAAP